MPQEPGSRARNSIEALQVLDRLEIGAPVLAPQKVTCPYRVVRGKETQAVDLVYSYEEPVFDADDPADRNLASLIGAQVALNYGLFAKEIVFGGELTEVDREFLEDMARNTGREIYVKKLLEPNPFLRGPAAELPAVPLDDYLPARLRFSAPAPVETGDKDGPPAWSTERSRHAILSSGGKDSLLTFGLLRELALDPQPIFINESGRHWYTALNSYRQLSASWPSTARVWTNSDRVFSWMLRQLPFIREDFASVRSDEYPIRLWTVAVFLFGALPLLKKRGIGRLLIGDEHDTTDRRSHKGITHYNGLFDQSRHFDNSLSRFYRRKRWGVSQFSVLRTLSELLIQKSLAQRYPELLAQQISCHAAHLEGERVHPCGRCEKCRRIVAMLIALDADPTGCGYSEAQAQHCLGELERKGLHQEAPGVEHLLWMLRTKGRLPSGARDRPGREHPEIVSLRIDNERSPVDGIPVDLRKPIYTILLEHAAGAVRRQGRVWIPFDLLEHPKMARPYTYERSAPRGARQATTGQAKDYLLGEMTWPQARARLKETDLALLPVGATEQHGPHLPLDTDAWDADHLARRVAAACSAPRPLVLPLIPYGVSYHHDDFSGTLSVSPETLYRMVHEVGLAASRHGITKLVIINGHGGNVPTLQLAAQMINRDAHIFTCVDSGDTSDADVARLTESVNDAHAGEVETSTALATRPELVVPGKARKSVPRFSSRYLDFSSSHSVEWYAPTSRISSSGVLGDPTKASQEKGEQIWRIMIDRLVEFVEWLKETSLDEIHERKY